MQINLLFIEFGVKNIDIIKNKLKINNINILYLSSFLDIIDNIYKESIHLLILSDFRGVDSTISYLKMFKSITNLCKIIILSNNKSIDDNINSLYIQNGAEATISIYNIELLIETIKKIYIYFENFSDIMPNWKENTKQFIFYIKNNYFKKNVLKEINKKTGYSYSTIQHNIKKDTNKSITDWISELRIKGAIKLLKETNYPVKYISIQLGYKSVQGFLKMFKKYTGKTPLFYRKNKFKNEFNYLI